MERNPLLSEPAPPSPGPAVPLDPEELWAEAQRHAIDEPDDDPFGFGGGLDFLDDEPVSSAAQTHPPAASPLASPHQPHPSASSSPGGGTALVPSASPARHAPAVPGTPARPAAEPSSHPMPCPHQPARTASASSHGPMPCPRQPARTASASSHGPMPCPRQPARTASAFSHGAAHVPSPIQTGTPDASGQTKFEPHAPHLAVPHRTDRRTALTAHLSLNTAPSGSANTPAAPPSDREAELQRATATLQQRCASLAAELAAAQARQGPLLQRPHRAGRAFAELITPTPPTGAPMPFSSLHAVLSSYRGAPPGAPH